MNICVVLFTFRSCFSDLINSKELKRKIETYVQKYTVPKTVYIASTAKIFACSNIDNSTDLSRWFPNYKLSPVKSATHLIMKRKQLSLDILCGILKGLIIYDENSKLL